MRIYRVGLLQAFAVPIAHGGFCSSYSCTLAHGADKTTPDNEVDHHQPTHKYKYKREIQFLLTKVQILQLTVINFDGVETLLRIK